MDHSLGENGEVEGGAWARLRRLTKRQRSIGLEREEGIMGVGNTRAYSSLTCTTKNVDETIPKKRNEISRQEGW